MDGFDPPGLSHVYLRALREAVDSELTEGQILAIVRLMVATNSSLGKLGGEELLSRTAGVLSSMVTIHSLGRLA